MDPRDKGVDATNQEFARYDQVRKRQEYRLAEHESEAFDDDYRLRACDLGLFLEGDARDRRRFADDLGDALADIGFAILENTAIDLALYDEGAERIAELFTRATLDEKMRYRAARHGAVNQGYFPMKETTDIHPDLVEGWVFCRRAFDLAGDPDYHAGTFWPLTAMEPFFRRHVVEHERFFVPVMQAILMGLGVDAHLFDERLSGTNFGLRLNYYPPVAEDDARSRAGRMLGHEDVDLFTLLPAPTVEGLQVLNRRTMKWVRLNAPRGSIVLNTGDYMQRISNDRLPSTTHRVSRPVDPTLAAMSRTSIPLAVYLREDDLLEVLPGLGEPRYEPVRVITFHTRTTSKYYGDDYAVED